MPQGNRRCKPSCSYFLYLLILFLLFYERINLAILTLYTNWSGLFTRIYTEGDRGYIFKKSKPSPNSKHLFHTCCPCYSSIPFQFAAGKISVILRDALCFAHGIFDKSKRVDCGHQEVTFTAPASARQRQPIQCSFVAVKFRTITRVFWQEYCNKRINIAIKCSARPITIFFTEQLEPERIIRMITTRNDENNLRSRMFK